METGSCLGCFLQIPLRLETGEAADAEMGWVSVRQEKISDSLCCLWDPPCLLAGRQLAVETERLSSDWSPEKSIPAQLMGPLGLIPFLSLASPEGEANLRRLWGSAGKAGWRTALLNRKAFNPRGMLPKPGVALSFPTWYLRDYRLSTASELLPKQSSCPQMEVEFANLKEKKDNLKQMWLNGCTYPTF